MAGPAIRAWEMAKALRACEVRLVSTQSRRAARRLPGAGGRRGRAEASRRLVRVLVQGYTLSTFPWIRRTDTIIVADIYDPMHLEYLEWARTTLRRLGRSGRSTSRGAQRAARTRGLPALRLRSSATSGSASSPPSRGSTAQLRGRPEFARCSMSRPASPKSLPCRRGTRSGVVPGIDEDDRVIPGAVASTTGSIRSPPPRGRPTRRTAPELRLYFLGVKHPNPDVPAMKMAADYAARGRARAHRQARLLQRLGRLRGPGQLSARCRSGRQHALRARQTAFSFRTRILDYLWAGLPIVAADGDTFADLIREHRWRGRARGRRGARRAIRRCWRAGSGRDECARARVRPTFIWSRALRHDRVLHLAQARGGPGSVAAGRQRPAGRSVACATPRLARSDPSVSS